MKRRLLIDCSFISTTNFNTGIQRVVRKVIENIYTLSDNSDYEPYEVILENNTIKHIKMDEGNKVIKENIVTTQEDIILLLDSTWHLDTWGSIEQAKSHGTTVIAVIYDLIPISHPQFCDESLVTLFNSWFNQAIDYVDGFITISHTVQNQLEEYLHINYPNKAKQKKFDFFHLGADLDYKKFKIHTDGIKKELISLYDTNKNIYLTVSTVEPRKNHKYLLDVFDKLWEQNVNVTLNIVGKKGWKVDDLITRIKEHPEYKKRLFHWDNLNDVELNYCYENSKMLLFPSYIEGFGLPIIESLNNKLPVMASDIPIHREVGGEYIDYFDITDKDNLVEKIKSIEIDGIPKKLIIEDDFEWINWRQSTDILFKRVQSMEKKVKVKKTKIRKTPSKIDFKSLIKSIPFLGWFIRWFYNLLKLNNIKDTLFMQQQTIQDMQNYIYQLENSLQKQQEKVNQIEPKVDQHILYQTNTIQERIDQFLFDTNIVLSNKEIKSMDKTTAIHQFIPTVAYGDSVSNGVLFTQKLLKEFGIDSNIYVCAEFVDREFKNEVYSIKEYEQSQTKILIYHHAVGHHCHDEIMQFSDQKILVYHNITPSHFFKNEKNLQAICDQGREQLKSAVHNFISAYADSDYNTQELKYYGYKNPLSLPILVDFDLKKRVIPNENVIKKYSDTYNILYVGRVVQNKCQHQLIDTAYFLKQKGVQFKLFIVGGASQPEYLKYLYNYKKNLDLESEVIITEKVSEEDLAAYYKNADLFLSLSEHEGFGMPLIEAMQYDSLVLAYNAGGVSSSVPEESLLFKKAPSYVAKSIVELLSNPNKRVNLIKKQQEHLKRFSHEHIKYEFFKYLESLSITIPNKPTKKRAQQTKQTLQIEGPFDSTYSLSIVNKDIALSLQTKYNLKLYSTEGYGDFEPNLNMCSDTVKQLATNSFKETNITIRNLYPPRTNAMLGFHKIIGPYGWEESKFSQKYAQQFNYKLSLLFTMSEYVKKVMTQSGVYTPKVTTGIVADNLLEINAKKLPYSLPSGFKLLHISSAFPRKGISILLEVFNKLTHENLDISLIIKTFPNQHNKTLEQLSDLAFRLEKTLEENVFLYSKNDKKILLINKDIPSSNIKYLYESCNLLIAPSYGEGFGLPMAEAMLHNLPVITTAYGGQSDFCTDDTSWLIDFEFEFASTHLSEPNSLWQVPKAQHLQKLIERLYNMPQSKRDAKTKKAKEFILDNYTKQAIAGKIDRALKSYPKNIKEQKIALFSTYNTKCGIAKYSKNLISKFEDKVTIFASNTPKESEQDETLNIIRCWNEGRETKYIEQLKLNLIQHAVSTLIIQYNFSFIPLKLLEELILFCKDESIATHLFLHATEDVVTPTYTDSFDTIKESLKQVTNIYVHTLKDMNYLKDKGVYTNTSLFPHGIETKFFETVPKTAKAMESIPTLATFGFLLPQKGVLELVDIAQQLHQQNIKVKLLLLTSIHPAPVSKELEKQLIQKIENSGIQEYITLETTFLTEEEIISKLSSADKVLFLYKNTQESSSAAVRMGILSQKEVITTPLAIFDDVKDVVTQTKDQSIVNIIETLKHSLSKTYDNEKQLRWIEQNSWSKISQLFYYMLR